MKTFTLFTLMVLFFLVGSKAQSLLTIEPNSIDLQIALDKHSTATSYVINNSSTTRMLRWVRMVEGAPSSWSSYVCDKNNCYTDSSNAEIFELAANSKGLLEITVTPNGKAGAATYNVMVYDLKDSVAANAVLSVDAVSDNTIGINEPKIKGISIFPIPAKEVLNVLYDDSYNVNSIQIYNMVGQKIKTVAVAPTGKSVAIPVNTLNKGMYFIHILSNQNDVATQTFTKE